VRAWSEAERRSEAGEVLFPLMTQRRAFARHVNYAVPLSVKGCALRVASQVGGVRLRRPPADRNP